MSEVIVTPADYRYIKNDSSFNPNRNKAIVSETIAETTKFFNDLANAVDPELEKRIDVISSYGSYRFNKGTKQLKDYVGRDLYKSLIGEKIMSKVRVMEGVNRLNGNDKFKKSILL